MPEKIPANIADGLEAELAGLEARIAAVSATDPDDERIDGWQRRIAEVNERLGRKRKPKAKTEKRPAANGVATEKRPG